MWWNSIATADRSSAIGTSCGIRPGCPDGGTRRVFPARIWNDKLDLVQAEAVADLVSAGSEQAARGALRSLAGEFSSEVNKLSRSLVTLRVEVEAGLDFPDEELELLDPGRLAPGFAKWQEGCRRLLATTLRGRALRDGLSIVIAGAPNAGKSSLLNRLSGYDAAIVTPIPGTTRDAIREQLDLDGLPLEIIDTAGCAPAPTPSKPKACAAPVRRSRRADRVLWVGDIREGLETAREQAQEHCKDRPYSLVLNKVDLVDQAPEADTAPNDAVMYVSALTGAGMTALVEHLKSASWLRNRCRGYVYRSVHVTSVRWKRLRCTWRSPPTTPRAVRWSSPPKSCAWPRRP